MHEVVEFRIPETDAQLVLGPGDGTVLGGSVRQITLQSDDPRFARIRDAYHALRDEDGVLFTSWEVRRSYSRLELDSADTLHLQPRRVFNAAGEDYGTTYDERDACHICGAGAEQIGDLHLDLRRLPKSVDVARSIADEWVVSQRFAEVLLDGGFTGFELKRVLHRVSIDDEPIDLSASLSGRRLLKRAADGGIQPETWQFYVWLNRREQHEALVNARLEERATKRPDTPPERLPIWHQLTITSPPVPLSDETQFGINIFNFDSDGEYRCPLGHVAGLNVLSELTVTARDIPDTDLAITREMIGRRAGLLRPGPLLLASPRLRRALVQHEVKGCLYELVHSTGS